MLKESLDETHISRMSSVGDQPIATPIQLSARSQPYASAARMSPIDLTVIAIYMVATLAVGLAMKGKAASADDYFLGARDLPAWAVMLSIVCLLYTSRCV